MACRPPAGLLCCLALALAAPAAAQPQPLAQDSLMPWVPDGPVYAVAGTRSRLYLSGLFSSVAPAGNRASGWLQTHGDDVQMQGLPPFDGAVMAIVADGAGGWFVGGRFERVGSTAHRNLVRLLPDGSVDPAWTAGADGVVQALAVSGTTLYVGGGFHQVFAGAGTPAFRTYAAAFNIASQTPIAWDPALSDPGGGFQRGVVDLAVHGSSVFLAGYYRVFDGGLFRIEGLLKVDAVGAPAPAGPTRFDVSSVMAIAIDGDTLYIGGGFDFIGAVRRPRLAAISIPTAQVTAWNPEVGGSVDALAIAGGTLYVGGRLTSLGGAPREGVGAVDLATGAALNWPAVALRNGSNYGGLAIAVDSQRVYVGGDFTVGSSRVNAAAFDRVSGALEPWSPNPSGIVDALVVRPDGDLWVGGAFRRHGAVARNYAYAVDLHTGGLLPWDPKPENGLIATMAVYDDRWLIVGGDFGRIDGQARAGLASFDTTTNTLTPFNPPPPGFGSSLGVLAMAIHGQTLFAIHGGIRALDLATGHPTAFVPPTFSIGSPTHLAVSGNALVISGSFAQVNGQARAGIAAVNLATGALLPFNPAPPGTVSVGAMVSSNDTVYASFRSGVYDNSIAAVTVSSGAWQDLNVHVAGVFGGIVQEVPVDALALYAGHLYIGGQFDRVGTVARSGLASVDPASGQLTAWAPLAALGTKAIHAHPAYLAAAGGGLNGFDTLWNAAMFQPTGSVGLPSPPAFLTASATLTQVQIDWGMPLVGARPTSYVLEAGSSPGLANLASIPVNGLGFTTQAPPGRYFLRVRSVTASGISPPTADIELAVACVQAPTSLAATVVNGIVTLGWTAPAGTAPTAYVIEAGASPGAPTVSLPAGAQTSFSGPAPVGVYYVRVKAVGACGLSGPSNEVIVTVSPPSPPGTPAGLAATVTGTTVTLTWTAPSSGGPVTGYVLDAGTSAGASNLLLGAPLGSVTTFTANGVASGTYYARVRAIGPGGSSPPAAEVTVIVP